ncbi:MAG: dTDP-4-dehydrorhamnose 3,5-epimerase [Treponema sp.]|nr:dTDP-4-dehydrorhamnose 3,5-epimerase [Treponema sp.]
MPFEFKKCPIEGLYEVFPKVFGDSRGYFFEVYNKKEFTEAGLSMEFVQDNQSSSTKGVLRGLHFQTLHPQGKLVRAVSGKVYDVAVDLRKDSKTFGQYHGVVLDSSQQNQFYIPKGFAHGFYVLSDTAVFAYKCTDFYHPEDEGGIMWNDASIGINWNVAAGIVPNLSKKDTEHPLFSYEKNYFDINGNWIGN